MEPQHVLYPVVFHYMQEYTITFIFMHITYIPGLWIHLYIDNFLLSTRLHALKPAEFFVSVFKPLPPSPASSHSPICLVKCHKTCHLIKSLVSFIWPFAYSHILLPIYLIM